MNSELLAKEILAKPQESSKEKIESIELSRLKTFAEHPFKVEENEDMANLIESIREQGILTPILVRPDGNGDYEIISGHRRVFACKALEMEAVPCIVKELSRDEAVVAMVDSDLQRERILPSEKAFAYEVERMELKAKIIDYKEQLRKLAESNRNKENFIAAIRKFMEMKEITPALLKELIEKIEVHETEGGRQEPHSAYRHSLPLCRLHRDFSLPEKISLYR